MPCAPQRVCCVGMNTPACACLCAPPSPASLIIYSRPAPRPQRGPFGPALFWEVKTLKVKPSSLHPFLLLSPTHCRVPQLWAALLHSAAGSQRTAGEQGPQVSSPGDPSQETLSAGPSLFLSRSLQDQSPKPPSCLTGCHSPPIPGPCRTSLGGRDTLDRGRDTRKMAREVGGPVPGRVSWTLPPQCLMSLF